MRPQTSSHLYQPLDGVFGSVAAVRVLRVLINHGGSLAVSDIARRTQLTLPSVRTSMRRLIEERILTGIDAGRTTIATFDRATPLAAVLIGIFAAERRQAATTLDLVKRGALRLKPRPMALWLYGSVARGNDSHASDIDIALVTGAPNAGEQAMALRKHLGHTLDMEGDRISVIAMRPTDVRKMAAKNSKLWRQLQRDVVVLAGDSPSGFVSRTPIQSSATW